MTPTLLIGDYIFVSKFDFGFTIPFTRVELVRWASPRRGDVIVFRFPRDESLHYVKRVVGVPGDTISFRGRKLVINGQTVSSVKVEAEVYHRLGLARPGEEIFSETLEGRAHWIKFKASSEEQADPPVVERTVPTDQFFVVGDSRDDSYDSRSWGFVPRSLLKGRARLISFSIDSSSSWDTLNKVRWKRCGRIIY